jgi:serine/threonine protein kinase
MTRICPHCGTSNREDAKFCNQCGALLIAPTGTTQTNASAASVVGQRANDPGATLVTVASPDDPGATIPNIPALDPGATNPNIPSVTGSHTTPHISPRTGLLPPETLVHERYLIVEKLGQGGMAAVYKVKDTAKRGDPVRAVKEMSQAALKESEREQAIENFHSEAEMLRTLDHPNLPKFFEEFQEEDRNYLVMEFIEGETLEDRLERVGKGLPEADVMDWAKQLCSVLNYLHERRPPIIFRDLKPGNIMVTKSGQIKLIDFGIARIFRRDKTHDTQVLGTPGYAPPEQYGKGQTDPRSDVYALGVTLHQLLTNYDPSSTPFSLPALHSLNPNVSPHIQVAIEKATKLKRDERYESISDFQSALFAPGAFIFRDGQRATNVAELVALSRQLPQEAAEHLYAERYETWLRTIGERKLVKSARAIRTSYSDQRTGLFQFLMEADKTGGTATKTATAQTAASASAATSLQVQPGTLDIGPVAAGQSGIASFSVAGTGGGIVSGEVKPQVNWLRVSPTHFNGHSTLIEVTAETGWLPGSQKHQGTIQVTGGGQRLILPVSIQVLGNVTGVPKKGPQARKLNQILKYTAPPQRQPELVKQSLSALMGFGLSLAVLLVIQQAIGYGHLLALLATPFFPLLLLGWTLVTTLGALIGRPGASLESRALTSSIASLLTLGLVSWAWTGWLEPGAFHNALYPEAFLVTTIITSAIAAALGAAPSISGWILRVLEVLARRATLLVFIASLVLGGYAGYLLTHTIPRPFTFLEPVGIVVGIIVGALVATRLNQYIRRVRRPPTTATKP